MPCFAGRGLAPSSLARFPAPDRWIESSKLDTLTLSHCFRYIRRYQPLKSHKRTPINMIKPALRSHQTTGPERADFTAAWKENNARSAGIFARDELFPPNRPRSVHVANANAPISSRVFFRVYFLCYFAQLYLGEINFNLRCYQMTPRTD